VNFRWLDTRWIQIAGTLCNIACRHCFITCGPKAFEIPMMTVRQVALDQGRALGVKQIYYTGGEPFLHPQIRQLTEAAIAVAALTIVTNALLLDEETVRWLAGVFENSRYSLDLRVSLDGMTPELLWDSTCPDDFLEHLVSSADVDVLLCTHTGIHWQRALPSGRRVINVGALGRPANDGRVNVWYALMDTERSEPFEFVPLGYDHWRLAHEMRHEVLPEQFVETVLTGWWTTCLEILPAKERSRGKF
jgi:hypothetical protein